MSRSAVAEQYHTALREQLGVLRSTWVTRSARTQAYVDQLTTALIKADHTSALLVGVTLLHAGWSWEHAQVPALAVDCVQLYIAEHRRLAARLRDTASDRSRAEHETSSRDIVIGDLAAVTAYHLLSHLPWVPPVQNVTALQRLSTLLQHAVEHDLDLRADERSLASALDIALALISTDATSDAWRRVLQTRQRADLPTAANDHDVKLWDAVNHAIQDVLRIA